MHKLASALAASALLISATASATSLQLPKGYYATNVNGESVSVFADNLTLNQGKQVITLRYANPHIVGPQELYQVVVSQPIYLVFDGNGQSNFSLKADIPTNIPEAKAYAKQPQFTLEQDGQQIAYQAYIGDNAIEALLAE